MRIKLIFLTLVLVFVLFFTGCKNGSNPSPSPDFKKSEDYHGFTDNAHWSYQVTGTLEETGKDSIIQKATADTYAEVVKTEPNITIFKVSTIQKGVVDGEEMQSEYLSFIGKVPATEEDYTFKYYVLTNETEDGYKDNYTEEDLELFSPLKIGDLLPDGEVVKYDVVKLPYHTTEAFKIVSLDKDTDEDGMEHIAERITWIAPFVGPVKIVVKFTTTTPSDDGEITRISTQTAELINYNPD